MGFNLGTFDGARIQKHTVLRLLYPWSLFMSFVKISGLFVGTYCETYDFQGMTMISSTDIG
jgi:hypothetical protein